jgi:hypothetical protein
MSKKSFGKYSYDDLRGILNILNGLKQNRVEFDKFSKQITQKLQKENEPPYFGSLPFQVGLSTAPAGLPII